MTDRVFRIPVPGRRLDNDQTSFNEKFGNIPGNHHQAAIRSASRVLGVTTSTLLAVEQPGATMLRAGARVRIVRATASHVRELGWRRAGCPVNPSARAARAALGREDAFDVFLPPESRHRQIRTKADVSWDA